MDKGISSTKMRIEFLNMWKLLIAIAKDLAGEEVDKEELKKELKYQEEAWELEKKACVFASLASLIGDDDNGFDIMDLLKKSDDDGDS